jgi:hypothetical protein
MTDPVIDMLIDHAVKRDSAGAILRQFELTDARHAALEVGPGRDAVTNAEMVRNLAPGRPRLNAALAALARQTHVPLSRRAPGRASDSAPPIGTGPNEDPVSYRHNAARGRRP